MATKQDLLRQFDENYNRFYEAVNEVNEKDFAEKWPNSDWGVREMVAHHTGWLGKLAGDLDRGDGVQSRETSNEMMDVIFADHVRGMRKQEVLSELKQSAKSYHNAVQRIPDDRIESDGDLEATMTHNGVDRFQDHIDQITAWRRAGVTRSAA